MSDGTSVSAREDPGSVVVHHPGPSLKSQSEVCGRSLPCHTCIHGTSRSCLFFYSTCTSFLSTAVIVRDVYAMGNHSVLCFWSNNTPSPSLDASVDTLTGFSGS